MEPFTFANSSNLHMPVGLKVARLDGYEKPLPYSTLLKRPDLRHRGSNLSPNSELYVTVQLFANSKPLTVHSQTPYKHFKHGRVWNQWLELPVNYSNLPADAQLAITVWDLSPVNPNGLDRNHHIPFGGTTISIFDENATLRRGRHKCRIWRHKAADGFSDSSTPWQEPRRRRRAGQLGESAAVDEKQSQSDSELQRLIGLVKKLEMGEIPEVKWLDQLVFRQIEKLERQQTRSSVQPNGGQEPSEAPIDGSEKPERGGPGRCAEGDPDHIDGIFFLYIEFPRFDHPVVFTDHEYPPPPVSSLQAVQSSSSTAVNFKPPPEVHLGPGIHSGEIDQSDTEGDSNLTTIYDPEVGYADNPAETKHRRLIRGQRNALDRDLKPNPKMRDFLNRIMSYGPSVELSDKEKDEVWRFRHHLTRDKTALTKLVKSVNWNEQTESMQAIALLPKWAEIDVDDALELLGPGVRNPVVRAYAVERLRKADDDELLLYLLQLVQALKFEPHSKVEGDSDSSLASFLIARSAANFKLANFLYWYLMVELDDEAPTQSTSLKKLFARVSFDLMHELELTAEGQGRRKTLLRQAELITVLTKISRDIQSGKGDRLRKIEQLKKTLADSKNELLQIDPPLPLPLDPEVKVVGVIPDDCNVFKSTLLPLYINFKTDTGQTYPLIFKTGDDLRQDQLVVQIIALMDRLLLKENLDLKLTPYRILATSTLAGTVQFVAPSAPLSAILQNAKYKGSILGYLRAHNPATPDAPSVLGVRKDAMDNYVKSVAGYCVITYLLGVGDRHLDNLLLTEDGHFLHIDFGYILGRDPKPMAPLMKLSREMVEGMGGTAGAGASQFDAFRQYCFTAYTTLRRSSALILNLFSLMQDAHIPGLALFSGDQAVAKVEERFKLDVDEDEAVRFFAQMIEREMGAWGAVLIDKLHGFTQGWKT